MAPRVPLRGARWGVIGRWFGRCYLPHQTTCYDQVRGGFGACPPADSNPSRVRVWARQNDTLMRVFVAILGPHERVTKVLRMVVSGLFSKRVRGCSRGGPERLLVGSNELACGANSRSRNLPKLAVMVAAIWAGVATTYPR